MDELKQLYGTGSVQWGKNTTHEIEPYKQFNRREINLNLVPTVDICTLTIPELDKLKKDIYNIRRNMIEDMNKEIDTMNYPQEVKKQIHKEKMYDIDMLWSDDSVKIVRQRKKLQKGGKKHYTCKKKINNRLSKKCRKCKSKRRTTRHNCKKLNKRTRKRK